MVRLIVTWLRWRHEKPAHNWLKTRAQYRLDHYDHL